MLAKRKFQKFCTLKTINTTINANLEFEDWQKMLPDFLETIIIKQARYINK